MSPNTIEIAIARAENLPEAKELFQAIQANEGVCLFYEGNGFNHSGDGFFEKSIS